MPYLPSPRKIMRILVKIWCNSQMTVSTEKERKARESMSLLTGSSTKEIPIPIAD